MATHIAFWRTKSWILSCYMLLEHHNCQRSASLLITSKTSECRFIIEYIYSDTYFQILKAFVRWLIKHSVHVITRFWNLVDIPVWGFFFFFSAPAAFLKTVPRFFTCSHAFKINKPVSQTKGWYLHSVVNDFAVMHLHPLRHHHLLVFVFKPELSFAVVLIIERSTDVINFIWTSLKSTSLEVVSIVLQ